MQMWMVWAWEEIYKVFFLNLEKKHGIHNQVWKLIVKKKEITDPKEESNSIKVFYEKLFKQNYSKINVEKWEFLNSQDTKTLTNNNQTYAKMKYKKLIYLTLWKVWKTNSQQTVYVKKKIYCRKWWIISDITEISDCLRVSSNYG